MMLLSTFRPMIKIIMSPRRECRRCLPTTMMTTTLKSSQLQVVGVPVQEEEEDRFIFIRRRYSSSASASSCSLFCYYPSHHHQQQRYLSFTTKDDNDNDPHKLFKAQLEELEAERKQIFGGDSSEKNGRDDNIDDGTIMSNYNNENDDDLLSQANNRHQHQHEEMMLLEKQLLKSSSNNSNMSSTIIPRSNNPSSSPPPPPSHSTEMMTTPEDNDEEMEIMELMHEDREALFQFTDEEKQAWSSSNFGKKVLSKELMKEIDDARRKQFDLENDQQQQQQQQQHALPPPATSTSTVDDNIIDVHHHRRHHHESFSHVTKDGTSIHMVDVGHKNASKRMAKAQTKVILPDDVLKAFGVQVASSSSQQQQQHDELIGPKGPIFATAKIAGIMAAKKTSDLIPLCHPLPLDQVQIDINLQNKNEVVINCTCRVTHKTGVEMEALIGSSIAALTIYDMVKAVSHEVIITDTKLISKTGGKRNIVGGMENDSEKEEK